MVEGVHAVGVAAAVVVAQGGGEAAEGVEGAFQAARGVVFEAHGFGFRVHRLGELPFPVVVKCGRAFGAAHGLQRGAEAVFGVVLVTDGFVQRVFRLFEVAVVVVVERPDFVRGVGEGGESVAPVPGVGFDEGVRARHGFDPVEVVVGQCVGEWQAAWVYCVSVPSAPVISLTRP